MRIFTRNFAAFAACLALSTPTMAATWTVDSTSADPALSACTSAPSDCSFPGAVNRAAFTGDSIVFTVAASLATEVAIAKSVTIEAAGAIRSTQNSPAPASTLTVTDSVFVANGVLNPTGPTPTVNTLVADNLGASPDIAGRVYSWGNTLSDVRIENNIATGPGGAIGNSGTLTLARVSLSGNQWQPGDHRRRRYRSGPWA